MSKDTQFSPSAIKHKGSKRHKGRRGLDSRRQFSTNPSSKGFSSIGMQSFGGKGSSGGGQGGGPR